MIGIIDMKPNCIISDENILGKSEKDDILKELDISEDIKILVDDLHQRIDRYIIERIFKIIDIKEECKDICNRIYIARNITMNADEIEEQMRRIDRLLREPNWN